MNTAQPKPDPDRGRGPRPRRLEAPVRVYPSPPPNEEACAALQGLLRDLREGSVGFRLAADALAGTDHERRLLRMAVIRQEFSHAIRDELTAAGCEDHGSRKLSRGTPHGWHALPAALSIGSPAAILSACVRGEQTTLGAYELVLDSNLPTGSAMVVRAQRAQVQANLEDLERHMPPPEAPALKKED